MESTDSTQAGAATPTFVRRLNRHLNDEQRQDLIHWSRELLEIRESGVTPMEKARRALDATYDRKVVLAVLSSTGSALKQLAWDDRSWAARLGLGGAAFAVAAFGGQGAGIAAVGTAIAVPLWIVLGAGSGFARMLIDELQAALGRRPTHPTLTGEGGELIQDGEWEFLDERLRDAAALEPGSMALVRVEPQPESLWSVFRRAYREARTRQEAEEERTSSPHPGVAGDAAGGGLDRH
ncbi:MAG TPA: hypothetical protein VGR27_14975 [Longimicrobiaceae bacterium]|nr:hypothetical protein [Longimicrobiaceae bacterium]